MTTMNLNKKIEALVSNVHPISGSQLETLKNAFGTAFPENDFFTCDEGIIFTDVNVYSFVGEKTGIDTCKAKNTMTCKNPVTIFLKKEDKEVASLLKTLATVPVVTPTLTVVKDQNVVNPAPSDNLMVAAPAATVPVTAVPPHVPGKRGRKADPVKKAAKEQEKAEKKAAKVAKKEAKEAKKAEEKAARLAAGIKRGRKADPVKAEAKAKEKAEKKAAKVAKKESKEAALAEKKLHPGKKGRRPNPEKKAEKELMAEAKKQAKEVAKKAKEDFLAQFFAPKVEAPSTTPETVSAAS